MSVYTTRSISILYYIWYRLFATSKSSFVGRSWVITRLSNTSAKTLPPFFFLISSLCNIESIAYNFIPNIYMFVYILHWCCYTCGMSTWLWHFHSFCLPLFPFTQTIIHLIFFYSFISAFHLVYTYTIHTALNNFETTLEQRKKSTK